MAKVFEIYYKRCSILFNLIAMCILLFSYPKPGRAESDKSVEAASRQRTWATPLKKPGLPNFFKVNNELYRGAQPSPQGMQELKKMGIKTVINLRAFHSDQEKIGTTGLTGERIPMETWEPAEEEVIRFLKIAADNTKKPVFVHCQHGADRTGLMCAMYRIIVSNWTKEEAIAEMTNGGFGFHKLWNNIIKFIQDSDIETIKRKSGSK